jgi:cyanophycinase-like exopeptidase
MSPPAGLIVIMGSGETAPTMIKPHRAIFERVVDRPAVLLDTPYGFQSNADDISTRAVGYFAASVGRAVEVVSWRRPPSTPLERERAVAALRDAGWVFAGPGSPTYSLRQWRDGPIPQVLADTVTDGGVLLFASAAALTLGSHTIPVYEIYKAGLDPHWVPGLDLLSGITGLPAVVIPHYDNAEGGHHDTRFCYLGEERLSAMEAKLPDEAFVLGVDEHTAVVLDLPAGTATVMGNGVLTIRRRGRSVVHPSGAVLELASLGEVGRGAVADGGARGGPRAGVAAGPAGPAGDRARGTAGDRAAAGGPGVAGTGAGTSLRAAADAADAAFSEARAGRDVDSCVAAILELEQVLVDWSADTLTSDEGNHARGLLRGMIVRLGALAEAGARDPREVLEPFVSALLEVRARARQARDWATSDRIRDHLTAAGVEVRDASDGATWQLR